MNHMLTRSNGMVLILRMSTLKCMVSAGEGNNSGGEADRAAEGGATEQGADPGVSG